jgi:hypothetical protein
MMKMAILFNVLMMTMAANGQGLSTFGSTDNAYNSPWTIHLTSYPRNDNPLQKLRTWLNCPGETVVDPIFDIRMQDFRKPTSSAPGSENPKSYNLVGYQGLSVSQTCHLMRSHLDSNTKNLIEVFLDDDKHTATLMGLTARGKFEDL